MMTTLPVIDADYLRALKKTTADKEAEARASLRPHEPVKAGAEVPWQEVVRATQKGTPDRKSHLGALISLLQEHGWDFKVGSSEYFSGDKYVKESGEVKHGETLQHVWLQAALRDGEHTLTYSPDRITLDGASVDFNEPRIGVESL